MSSPRLPHQAHLMKPENPVLLLEIPDRKLQQTRRGAMLSLLNSFTQTSKSPKRQRRASLSMETTNTRSMRDDREISSLSLKAGRENESIATRVRPHLYIISNHRASAKRPDSQQYTPGLLTAAFIEACKVERRKESVESGILLPLIPILLHARRLLRGTTRSPQLLSTRLVHLDSRFPLFPKEAKGRRHVVLIGVNYSGNRKVSELSTAQSIRQIQELIIDACPQLRTKDIHILSEEPTIPRANLPTKENITRLLDKLYFKSGDSIFWYFCGYAGKGPKSRKSNEQQQQPHCLYPMDFAQSGVIPQDELFQHIFGSLPKAVHITALIDCNVSNWGFELPFHIRCEDDYSQNQPKLPRAHVKIFSIGTSNQSKRNGDFSNSGNGGGGDGLLTAAFLLAMSHNPDSTWIDILNSTQAHFVDHQKLVAARRRRVEQQRTSGGGFLRRRTTNSKKEPIREELEMLLPTLSASEVLRLKDKANFIPKDLHGTKRALLIGIGYDGTERELSGAHKAVRRVHQYLQDAYNFEEMNITTLLDNALTSEEPTRENILRYLARLARETKIGDLALVHFVGHGELRASDPLQVTSSRERAKCLMVPSDYKAGRLITEQIVAETFLLAIPEGAFVTLWLDSWHESSTTNLLDMPYEYISRPSNQGRGNSIKSSSQSSLKEPSPTPLSPKRPSDEKASTPSTPSTSTPIAKKRSPAEDSVSSGTSMLSGMTLLSEGSSTNFRTLMDSLVHEEADPGTAPVAVGSDSRIRTSIRALYSAD